MYYVPDGTKECGYYECKKCGNRFLSMQTMKRIPCPDCEAEIDYEIGPDQGFGCNKAQGYFYARPMREAEYTELLRKEKAEN